MSFENVFRVWPILLITLLFLTACSDDGTSPQPTGNLTGQVLDADGAPVADAGILIDFALPGKKMPRTGIGFDLADTSQVKIWIMSDCSTDTVLVLVDGTMDPGPHLIIWDGRNAEGLISPSGQYSFFHQVDDDLYENEFLLIHGGYSPEANPSDYQFQATTGSKGHFVLGQDCLPFGYTFATVDEMGDTTSTWTVTREVRFFTMHADHRPAASDWVTADENTGCNVTIQFAGRK